MFSKKQIKSGVRTDRPPMDTRGSKELEILAEIPIYKIQRETPQKNSNSPSQTTSGWGTSTPFPAWWSPQRPESDSWSQFTGPLLNVPNYQFQMS